MARPTLDRHPKFRYMMRLLNIPRPLARGYLELMWDAANESGNPVFENAEFLAAAVDYDGDPCKLCTCLVECNLLDVTVDGKYAIHDYWDHCPEYALNRAKRESERMSDKICCSCGNTYKSGDPRAKYCSTACKVREHRKRHQVARNSNVTECNVTDTYRYGTPTPTPLEDTNVSSSPLPPVGERQAKEDSFKNLKAELQTAWNTLADTHGLPRAEAWNETRTKSLRARAAHAFWRDNWREALTRVPLNPWNLGENDRGWRANIDWFLRDKTVPQLIERTDRPKQQDFSDPEIVAKYANKGKSQ